MIYTYNIGGAYHGGNAGVIIKDLSITNEDYILKEDKKIIYKLKELQNTTTNTAKIKVSKLYIQRCASCHGINGNGIIGPKLFDKKAKDIYKTLQDYKIGTLKNVIMQKIAENLNNKQARELSDEIGNFSNLNKKDF